MNIKQLVIEALLALSIGLLISFTATMSLLR